MTNVQCTLSVVLANKQKKTEMYVTKEVDIFVGFKIRILNNCEHVCLVISRMKFLLVTNAHQHVGGIWKCPSCDCLNVLLVHSSAKLLLN